MYASKGCTCLGALSKHGTACFLRCEFVAVRPCRSLAAALYSCRDGTGEVRDILTSATFCPRLPGEPFRASSYVFQQ